MKTSDTARSASVTAADAEEAPLYGLKFDYFMSSNYNGILR